MDRRRFLTSLSAAGLAAGLHAQAQEARPQGGPDLDSLETWTGMRFSAAEREQMTRSVGEIVERLNLRRSVELPNSLAPASTFDPYLGANPPTAAAGSALAPASSAELPSDAREIAFAPIDQLRSWLDRKQLSSVELTELYLERCKRLDKNLHAIITLTPERALAEARAADQRLAKGESTPLLGIPYAAKDLFDTAQIRTTYGAKPYAERVPTRDAVVIERLTRAGAVLIAKSSLGALAYGDIWFGGQTRCPWNPELGSSGSSAGSCAGVAAGLYPFALGTETYGSILSPSARNGTTGLRPTFGRVPRTGAMALCWSLDKVGPIVRRVADAGRVMEVLVGPDAGDASSVKALPYRARERSIEGLRVGYDPRWFEDRRGGDPAVLEHLRALGLKPKQVQLPEGPWASVLTLLMVEAAAAFEELTRSDRDDELTWQDDDAWPNTFRSYWGVPAIEVIQADRLRRRLCEAYQDLFSGLDLLISPPFASDLTLTTNFTGHPCLILRAGVEDNRPSSLCLWGQLGADETLIALGSALEAQLDCWHQRPPVS